MKLLANSGQSSKFIVAVLGTITAALATYYSGAHWVPLVSEILTAVAVYLVPNQPAISQTGKEAP